jgi:methylenetetrahydrofolate reductase (NADPH)
MVRATQSARRDGLNALLERPRFELMPFDSFGDQMTQLPDGATITITTSPTLGLDATLEWTERAADAGYEIVPHIAARYVEDEAHLAEIVDLLDDAGVTDIFVPGGDRETPIGEYDSAYEMLADLDGLDHPFDDIGITGYPEGHAFLDDDTLAEAMAKKEPLATYIVTQLCYDPDAVIEWVEDIRDRGVKLPVSVGLPGVMKYQRLLQISSKVGVGDSVRFLRKTSGVLGFIRQLVGSRGKYTPDSLVDGLAPYATDPEYGLREAHIYTFNQVADIEDWRRERLPAPSK